MQEDLSADDYPATYGGVLLCCTYTVIITGRFLFEALLQPLLRALCLSCVMPRRLCACPTSCVNVAPSRFLETVGYCPPSVARPDIASQSALHLGGACVWRVLCHSLLGLVCFMGPMPGVVGCTGQVHPLPGGTCSNSRSISCSDRAADVPKWSQSSSDTPQHWREAGVAAHGLPAPPQDVDLVDTRAAGTLLPRKLASMASALLCLLHAALLVRQDHHTADYGYAYGIHSLHP